MLISQRSGLPLRRAAPRRAFPLILRKHFIAVWKVRSHDPKSCAPASQWPKVLLGLGTWRRGGRGERDAAFAEIVPPLRRALPPHPEEALQRCLEGCAPCSAVCCGLFLDERSKTGFGAAVPMLKPARSIKQKPRTWRGFAFLGVGLFAYA